MRARVRPRTTLIRGASVAARLIRSRVGNVLAMNYADAGGGGAQICGGVLRALAAGATWWGGRWRRGASAPLADIDRHTLTRRSLKTTVVRRRDRSGLADWSACGAVSQQAANPVIFKKTNRKQQRLQCSPLSRFRFRRTYPESWSACCRRSSPVAIWACLSPLFGPAALRFDLAGDGATHGARRWRCDGVG